jgi:short-subunit dehydrogenase
VERLAETAISTFGGFDVWINNAGVGVLGRFDEVPLEDHERVIQTNLLGQIYGSHAAIRHFRERGAGNLINVASTASKVAQPYFSSYCASKFGVLGLSAAIREELAVNGDDGVTVSVVHPWAIDTPFFQHAGNYTGRSLRMPLMQDPAGVVDAIAGLVEEPEDDVEVGVLVKGSVLSSHLAPGLTEAMSAKVIHKTLMEDAPVSAGNTAGSVHESLPVGTTVEGGNRERIAREDAAKAG